MSLWRQLCPAVVCWSHITKSSDGVSKPHTCFLTAASPAAPRRLTVRCNVQLQRCVTPAPKAEVSSFAYSLQKKPRSPTQQTQLRERKLPNLAAYPTSVQDIHHIVAANAPVFYLHPEDQFNPCTVDWFLERCQLCSMKNSWTRRVVDKVWLDYGKVNNGSLKTASKEHARERLQLKLLPAARGGQAAAALDELVPVYAHVKEVVDPYGRREALEVNYCNFHAYNGSYKIFGFISVPNLGAHDSDWEHVTLRFSPDGRQVLGAYYSAHRHRDGIWRSADEMPRTADGRPVSYVAVNGHGNYPTAGTIPRVFWAFNDQTSDQGVRWSPKQAVVVTQDGRLPQVVSRGDELNGSTYTAVDPANHVEQDGAEVTQPVWDPSPGWLAYEGKWGSTVVAPQLQEWFRMAENPVSRTWVQQVFLPLVPGVDSLLEPIQEDMDTAMQYVDEQIDAFLESADSMSKSADDKAGTLMQSAKDIADAMRKSALDFWQGSAAHKDKGKDKDDT